MHGSGRCESGSQEAETPDGYMNDVERGGLKRSEKVKGPRQTAPRGRTRAR